MNTSLLLWMTLLPLFFMPACAVGAGIFTWAITRRERPQDGELLRHFLVAMGLLLIVSYAGLTTDAVKERLDPSIRARRDIHATPVVSALRDYLPAEWAPIDSPVERALAARQPASQVLSQLRPAYLPLVRRLLPFADGAAVRGYAEALLPALRELQTRDPQLCVRLAWARAPGAPWDLNAYVSAPVAAAYETAVAGVISRNQLVTSDKRKPPGPVEPVSLAQLQATYAAIMEAMQPRYGPVSAQLHSADVAQLEPDVACDATIDLLSRAMAQPPATARRLLAELLRS